MKILFVSPEQGISSKRSTPVPPSALLFIAGLTPDDVDIEFVDLTYEKLDYDQKVDLVAISVMTIMAPQSYEVADNFRKRGTKVVLGGHHCTALPLEAKQHADIVVIGEAEYIWEKVIRDFEKGESCDFYIGGNIGTLANPNLPGKVFRDERIPDLVKQPHMRRDLLKKKYIFDVIFTTKGCPYDCSFCSVTKFFGKSQRHRPVDDVIKELHECGKYIFISDDNCYFPSKYYLPLYDRMYKEFKGKKKWYSQGSLSVVKEKNGDQILEAAAKSGQMAVFIGLESINPDSLLAARAHNKIGHTKNKIDLEFTRKAIEKIQSHGIMVWAFLILGFYQDTPETFAETLKFLDETKVLPMPISLCPLPGTDLWDEYENTLLPNKTWDMWDGGHALFEHPNFTPTEFEDHMNSLRLNLFSTGRIMKRLWFNGTKYLPMNISVETGMRKSFQDVYKKVLEDRARV